jgi:hypothetical protein
VDRARHLSLPESPMDSLLPRLVMIARGESGQFKRWGAWGSNPEPTD